MEQEITIINDDRDIKTFKTSTFSNYKKSDVITSWMNSMLHERIEHATYWNAELICSGHFIDIWETTFTFFLKYINIANPKLVLYLVNRYEAFKKIMITNENDAFFNELDHRNIHAIRVLFAEIVSVLTYSKKANVLESMKIERHEEFDLSHVTERLKADNLTYSETILKKGDPDEFAIPINELAFHLEKGNYNWCCYWVEWIIEFDALCRSKKTPIVSDEPRIALLEWIEHKCQYDCIWLVWDTIEYYISTKITNHNAIFFKQIVEHSKRLFCIKYRATVVKKRKFFFYFLLLLLCGHIGHDFTTIQLFENKETIICVTQHIDDIYKQIKNNEQIGDENVFAGYQGEGGMKEESKHKLKQSIAKMKLLSNVTIGANEEA